MGSNHSDCGESILRNHVEPAIRNCVSGRVLAAAVLQFAVAAVVPAAVGPNASHPPNTGWGETSSDNKALAARSLDGGGRRTAAPGP